MLRLKTFGQPIVERDGSPVGGAARQRRVIALLAVVAAARARGVSRDRVLGLLWSEREPEKARQSLTQSLYHARKVLAQDDLFFAAADLQLNPEVITTDIDDFADAIDRGDLRAAVALYQGPFLDGFHLSDAPEFERWISEEREAYHARATRALEQLASGADAASDYRGAADWWKRLAAFEPLNSRIALALMHALAKAGDRAGAIRYARIHETLLREQLDVAPDPAIAELADQLRLEPVREPVAPSPAPPHVSPAVAAVAPNAGSAAESGRLQATPRFRRRRLVLGVAAALAAFAAVVVAIVRLSTPSEVDHQVGELVVVAPFRVSGADPSLAYLREGLVDLIVTSLSDDRSGVADPSAVLNSWRRAESANGTEVPQPQAIELAKRLGGGRLLTGSVVGSPRRVVVSAAVTALDDGRIRAQASADGPADSLTTIVDRLVARLLVKEAGEWERLANHTSASPRALRAYLDGQAAYRRGSYNDAVRHFRRALERDPSFAMAGLALATAAERIDAGEALGRGLAAAWAARSKLTARDSSYLHALAGPRYPKTSSAREHLSAWERAAAMVGDRADVWHELGERLFYDGQALGLRDWSARATAAFQRAATLDPEFASPVQYLVQLAAVAGDTARVRDAAARYLALDSTGDLAPFVRWRAAAALGDRAALAKLRSEFPTMPAASLRAIALSAQYNGIAPGDASGAVAALATRAARASERADALLARHALAVNRGARNDARDAADMLGEYPSRSAHAARLQVADYLYAHGDSTEAARAAERLRRLATRGGDGSAVPSSIESPEGVSTACMVRQWRAWLNAAASSDSTALLVGREAAGRDSAGGELCTALADAIEATAARLADAAQRAELVDSLTLLGITDGDLREYAGLALARVWVALGENRRALDAVRRRPYMQPWPQYLAAHLELEGRIAESLGDSTSALTSYTRYLTLRNAAEAAEQPEVIAARTAIARLSKGLEPGK